MTSEYYIMALGNTKAGKTTFINNLISIPDFLKSDTTKATEYFWYLTFDDSFPNYSFKLKYGDNAKDIEGVSDDLSEFKTKLYETI